MEYTIYNESLVYYALQDKSTSKYIKRLDTNTTHYDILGWLHEANFYPSITIAEENAKMLKEHIAQCKDMDFEIRQVKVIDIGSLPNAD